ncbi:MAG: YncE family protein, partial [Bacteroidaceae bacterium]|nr:YncE family protein [Bacteroidaceae bacterium]
MHRIISYFSLLSAFSLTIMLFSACREVEIVVPTQYAVVPEEKASNSTILGMYLVNEGNMGSNKCSLDYLDYANGYYIRNLYADRNPHVIMELGDVGNDAAIYGSKLYVVVNCSNKVEVINAFTGKRVGQINLPNCR